MEIWLWVFKFLFIGVTALCIRHNGRTPNGLLLSYPCLNLDLNRFTSSYLIGNKYYYF